MKQYGLEKREWMPEDLQELTVMQLRPQDMPMVAKWTGEWLGSAHPLAYSLTVFSSSGYTTFLEYQQAIPPEHNQTWLYGAYDEGVLLGFIELRRIGERLFINNFCVQKEARGRSIGSLLLSHTEYVAKQTGAAAVALDCFAWNERALEKYAKSGYTETNRIHWWTGRNAESTGGAAPAFIVTGYPNAEVNQKEFGFSQFYVETDYGVSQVNRLGDLYFRVPAEEPDPGYYKILSQLDRHRNLFMIRQDEEEPGDGWRRVSTSVRLEKQLN
ncbi:GNAT family N-acetyltransferase [Domibacillus indicus]|uniref:GNAT family N-acetyltransferase n=1 Tax=Domibacillus indicus TaxID=1437523 RepID=UPI0018CD3434|nr:GNAT family N-acetyltransferase [Domibacillus indicus]